MANQISTHLIIATHVHLLVRPQKPDYKISQFITQVKKQTAKRYCEYLKQNNLEKYNCFLVKYRGVKSFQLWQRGGGFDRNLWHEKAVHDSIEYIESNPVQAKLVAQPEEWQWSSAYARVKKEGVIPDIVALPARMLDLQKQSVGVV